MERKYFNLILHHIFSPWNSWSVACKNLILSNWSTRQIKMIFSIDNEHISMKLLNSMHCSISSGECILIAIENTETSFRYVFRFLAEFLFPYLLVFFKKYFLLFCCFWPALLLCIMTFFTLYERLVNIMKYSLHSIHRTQTQYSQIFVNSDSK